MGRKLTHQLTKEQHTELATLIRKFELDLRPWINVLYGAYGVADKTVVQLEKLVHSGGKLCHIRSLLDDRFYQEFRDKEDISPYFGWHNPANTKSK